MTDCAAIEISGQHVCERCALAWDEGDTPPACKGLTLGRLHMALDYQVQLIEGSQRALVAGGDRKFSDQRELERAQLLRAGIRLVERILSDATLRERLKQNAPAPSA